MKILFIYKRSICELIGPMIISSLLRKNGFSPQFIDLDSHGSLQTLKKIIIEQDQNCILGYSTPTDFYPIFFNFNRRLKQQFPRVFSLFGGPHPTFFPEIIDEEGVDGVCIGEGEYPVLELARNLREKRPITGIQNLWIKQNGRIYKNSLRPLIGNLDELPFPDRAHSNNFIFFKAGKVSVLTSRGCPHRCSFCFNETYNRLYNNSSGKVRRRSTENVIEEIQNLKSQFPLTHILFLDDIFILDKSWLEKFLDEYRSKIKLPYYCQSSAGLITPEIARLLKKSGCVWINIGIECGNADIRKRILKKNIEDETILNAARLIKKEGIYLRTTNLLGIPGASLAADYDTLKLNIKCKPDWARGNILSLYPNLDIYRFAQKHDLVEEGLELIDNEGNWYLKRRYKNNREKRRQENLSRLFSLIVRFPFLLRWKDFLIGLPLDRLYAGLGNLFLVYQTYFCKISHVNEGMFIRRFLNRRKVWKDIVRTYIFVRSSS